MSKKIIIIGAGHVGAAVAHSLVVRGLGDEIGVLDLNEKKAYGEVLDLQHALPYTANSAQQLFVADYEDTKDADIIVFALHSEKAVYNDSTDRLSLLAENAKEAKAVAKSAHAAGFKGVYIVISNPVDIITRIVQEHSGLPVNQVLGTGTLLETSRLKSILSQKLDVNPKVVDGFAIGEHGFSAFGAWSTVTVEGKSVKEVYPELDFDQLDQEIRDSAYEVFFARNGVTSYGIANVAVRLVEAIVEDQHVALAVGTYVNGEYGLKGIYIGTPAVIGKNGVEKVLELPLTKKELEKLNNSYQILSNHYETLKSGEKQ